MGKNWELLRDQKRVCTRYYVVGKEQNFTQNTTKELKFYSTTNLKSLQEEEKNNFFFEPIKGDGEGEQSS